MIHKSPGRKNQILFSFCDRSQKPVDALFYLNQINLYKAAFKKKTTMLTKW